MSKKPNLLGLAAVIPAYSNISTQGDYDFSITAPIYKNATLLDTIILQCKLLNVNSIILVCRPEQILYMKSKYGDTLYWIKDKEIVKTITMFYISVSTRYFQKYDSVTFNQIYGAYIFNSAVLDSFGKDFSKSFLMIDPRHIFDPTIPAVTYDYIKQYYYGSTGDMMFAHESVKLPYHAYSFISIDVIKKIWEEMTTLIKVDKMLPTEFAKLTLPDFYNEIKEPERVFELQFKTFDLGTWQNYVELISHIQNSLEDSREYLLLRCKFNKTILSFRRISDFSLLDTPFSQKIVDFNNATKSWYKRRLEIRKNNERTGSKQ